MNAPDDSLRSTIEASRQRLANEDAARAAARAFYTPTGVWNALRADGYEDRKCIVGGPKVLATAMSDVIQGRAGGLLLHGRCGNGKTLAAKWMHRNGNGWQFVEPIKDAWRYNHKAYSLLDWPGVRALGLVIDDLGSEPAINHFGETAELYGELFTMHLSDWYGRFSPKIVITANLSPDQLQDRYGARVWSRVLSHLIPVQFDGGDQRQAVHYK